MTNKDQFGYYMVGDYKTYSKIEAIEIHAKSGVHPTWHFNESVFSQLNWTVEPEQSIEELYRIRAQQIRDQYDYIVLFYSGGADSQNMLNSFVRNGIHVDEVASFWALEGDRDTGSHFSSEIHTVAIPHMLTLSNVKHRVIDLTQMITEIYTDPDRKFDFLYDMNSMFSPNNYARSLLRERVRDYQDIIASGKRLCFVYGSEKPRTFLENGRYCIRFLDVVDNCVSARTQRLNRDWEHDELFYWSADLPQLIAKQGHLVKNYLRSGNINPAEFSTNTKQRSFGSIQSNSTHYLISQGLHRVIYGLHNTYNLKPSSNWFSERDKWFLNNPHQLAGSQNYVNGIDKLKTLLPEYWTNGGFSGGIKGCVSPAYWLE
jgi:hypothetical protein